MEAVKGTKALETVKKLKIGKSDLDRLYLDFVGLLKFCFCYFQVDN